MNLDCEKGHSLAELVQNLAEAIAWCSSRPRPWSPFATFRSADIAPRFGSNSRKSWIQSVARQRRRALGAGSISLQRKFCSYEGRLLAYFPDENLACGVAEAETQGFFTVDNVPPWDTWVAYLHEDQQTNYLVSWVPGPLTRIVDGGVRVIPEECVGWVDERCPQLVKSLAAQGIELAEFGPGAK
jgi:hypothetical protein